MAYVAVLRKGEEDGITVQGVQYEYEYDEHDNFFVFVDGEKHEEPSTAYNIIEVDDQTILK